MAKAYLLQVALVGMGGFIGSAGRFMLSGLVHRFFPFTFFPVGTLVVNAVGCLAIGLIGGLVELRQVLTPEIRIFLLIGVLGGFTTFSTFAFETFAMGRDAEVLKAFFNIFGQVALGIGCAWLGYMAARFV